MKSQLGITRGPLPAPDRRWQTALACQESGTFAPAQDPDVRLAVRYLQALRRPATARYGADPVQDMPVMHGAYLIYTAQPPLLRHILEARVLADEAPAAIAAKIGLDPATIQCYSRIFFDVAGHLAEPDYVLATVLGPRFQQGVWDYDLVWKYFGYVGGPHVLDRIMNHQALQGKPTTPAQADEFLSDTGRRTLERLLALTASGMSGRDPLLARQLLLQQAAARRKAEADQPQNILERHIAALIEELPWSCGKDGANEVTPAVAEFDQSVVELRDDELLRLSAGEHLPELDELKTLEMPAPTPKTQPAPAPSGDASDAGNDKRGRRGKRG